METTNFYITKELQPYELVGYVQGDKICMEKDLTLHHFDVVKIISESECAKTRKIFFHADAWLNTRRYFLILKKI